MLRLGLIGYPLGHSLSPQLHQAALDAMNVAGTYTLYPVPPGEDGKKKLLELCAALRHGEIQGLNVTIPHKRSLLPYIDSLTGMAQAAGALNTLYLDGDRLCADNTDAPGFLTDLAQRTGWPEARPPQAAKPIAWVLGAGGSARAVACSLTRAGWHVVITARRVSQAQDLVDALSPYASPDQLSVKLLTRDALKDCLEEPGLLVNATPLGMHPLEADSPWPAGLPFPGNAFVYDLVYNPAQTVFVQGALRAGLRAYTGLGMLVEQAALSLERWTRLGVPREAMWNAVKQFHPSLLRESLQ